MMTRRFTGWHMTGIMLLFFGVIVAVNITMAVFAATTFGGKVVENSYVASQKYNEWLAAAREQQQLGWTHKVTLDSDRHVALDLSISGAKIKGTARHPLGQDAEIDLSFGGEGSRYRSSQALPAGRWILHLTVTSGGDGARYIETVQ